MKGLIIIVLNNWKSSYHCLLIHLYRLVSKQDWSNCYFRERKITRHRISWSRKRASCSRSIMSASSAANNQGVANTTTRCPPNPEWHMAAGSPAIFAAWRSCIDAIHRSSAAVSCRSWHPACCPLQFDIDGCNNVTRYAWLDPCSNDDV